MDEQLTFWDVFSFACTILLLVSAIALLVWIHTEYKPNMRDCYRGGYESYASVPRNDSYTCIGVIDGEWKIELLDDVRARMEANDECQ